jgi:hypothetical protein
MQDQLADLLGSRHERRHASGESWIERSRIVRLERSRLQVRGELRDHGVPRCLISETGHDQTAGVIESRHHVVARVRSRVSRYRDQQGRTFIESAALESAPRPKGEIEGTMPTTLRSARQPAGSAVPALVVSDH